ncbi:sugar ABC transporter permease [bacterium (Candidatus Blackallbacteria) CG17_big_fil_post_rev_8_21_14_2_50_48_46]|uniref:Sugar ABC transporter permease n=1 Tax=bacterium (Candidatus Blackallbacteria) CG17_big_fil_post_rev_8_21_14_2_50_48_46 TaxID=2014261 RepID=A0A2M7G084_9BACT|nr:MAG: sugar ABC transporter permease [bacterium (Candidatus Blackallbacteria) CG18_big_fil_WC_8_21_14_2_50_49_26]PIW14599.1 MAG: sugar ABC transporter permease [bacterium (Candidatus Blackallbacteria) CG17_big_fil_post_rev_8_21_14_2_50_48_46]PIW45650.1 MAG: sugar ABC transporter permease [bacterium (Candidatus Blackallbacteria) CG13_big_fil_rev_8_21_14_2_50_49_14]
MKNRSELRWALLMLLPSLLGVGIFTLIPVLASFGLSFAQWNLLSPPKWIGLANYSALLAEPLFWKVLGNTFIYAFCVVLFEVPLALALAIALNQQGWVVKIFRTIFFLPVVTSMIAIALVWNWIYDPQYGLLNAALQVFQIKPVAWLFSTQWALPSLILMGIWKNVGYSMVIFLAGLQNISDDLYEAASLDGANRWQQFLNVTLPMISPTLFFVMTMSTITAFQIFDSVYMMTQGGPENSTNVAVYWLYQNAFEFFQVGRASAMAYVLFAVILTMTLIQWSLRKKWVAHES